MDNLTAENFIIMGGPLTGSLDVLPIVSAENEQRIHPWTLLLHSQIK
jgi:hypothetical protein